MGKKRIHRKPVALTFADTSNQPTEQDAEGCSSWNPSEGQRNQRDNKGSTKRGQENGDEDEIECMGMVSSSTASSENKKNNRPSNREALRRQQEEEEQRIRQKEEEEFQRALELSRQEMQVTSVTNSTSDGIISNEESEGENRVETNNGVHVLQGGESDEGSSDLENVGLVVHGEAQAQTRGRSGASRENSGPGRDGSSDGDDSDVTDISNEEEAETGIADGAGGRAMDDVDEEANGDDDSSVGSSILLQSDEEEITAGQPPHASSSYPTQSSEKVVAKVGPLEDREGQEGSIDIFDVMEDQDQLSQELFVDSQRTHQGYEPEPESTHSQEEDRGGSSNMDSRRTRLSLRKRKRDGEEGSEAKTYSSKTKVPRLAPISDSESDVDVEVQASDDEGNISAPPSQDPGFMDFPQRFADDAGVPLVDRRKPNHKSPFLTPHGVSPNSYTAAILRLFYQYKIRLLKAQAKQRHRIELGRPVAVGPYVKDTIVFKKRGQKPVFQWLLSSDEESAGVSQENDQEEANQARLVKPLRTELGHLSKVFHNNNDSNKVRIVTGNQQAEARPAGFKPKVEWTRSISGSSGVQNNARTVGSVSLKSGDEVSSSRVLVIKVSPVQKNKAGEWISKSGMGVKREAKSRLSSSDDSDADVEVVPRNTTTRTPLTATVSPRRSTPAESQSSSSLRSPVFGGKSSRGLVRPSSGVTRQVGHCSPRTLQNNRDKMESPQPSSPRLRVDNDMRTQAVVVAESASGVSSTVPDNGARHAMLSVERHQEATASGSVSSAVPTSRTSADSPADPARTCPTSTNHAEQGSNSDAASASSRLTSSSMYGPAHSFEEERLLYYKGNRVKAARPEENGVGDVGSSNVNRSDESNNVESEEEESIVQENISRREQKQTNGAVDNSGDVVDRLAARNDEGDEDEMRTGDEQHEEQGDQDAELQNTNEAAVSIGTNSPIAEMDDNILDEGGGRIDGEEVAEDIVEPVRGEADHEEEEEEAILQEDGEIEPVVDGVQCPLCGVTFAMTVIEVHAAECNGPPENAEPVRPEPARRPGPVPGPARPASPRDRIVARMEMLDRTSSEDEADNDRDDDDDVMVSGVSETSKPVGRQNVRKRTFPSTETTSDSPTSSVGSMSHFDNVVQDMVRRNEIKVSAPGPSSSSSRQPDRTHPAPKRGKWQSKTTSSHAVDSDEDEDDEPGEVEKCFICNKFIIKSQYRAHVQNELDRMDASNNSQVESSSTPSRNTRQAVTTSNENGGDAVPSAVSTSTASSRRQTSSNAAAVGGSVMAGASRSRTGNAQGTRVKRVVDRNGGEATSSTSHVRSDNGDLSSDEESGPNSPSALDAYLLDSDDDDDDEGNSDDDEVDREDRVLRDPSTIPFSDSPVKSFKSLKHNPPCLIDFKNQFNTSGGGKTPKRSASRGAGSRGSGRGRGRGKGKGKWKSGKKWGRGGKSRK